MRLSELLEHLSLIDKYEIKDEREFDCLALVDTVTKLKSCTFVDDEKVIARLPAHVTMVITTTAMLKNFGQRNFGLCLVESPRTLFFRLHNALASDPTYRRKPTPSVCGHNCRISPLSLIAEHNVTIGNDVIIEEFVSIKENVSIGNGSIIRAGTILGGGGFEVKRLGSQTVPVEHLGGVMIGENVGIQYNSCVDKAVFPYDDTVIGDFCKIDNLVHIAHAVKLGRYVEVAANACIAGRALVGDDVWIGPSVTVRNGLTIGHDARCNLRAVVTKPVACGQNVSGNFAIDHDKFIEIMRSRSTK